MIVKTHFLKTCLLPGQTTNVNFLTNNTRSEKKNAYFEFKLGIFKPLCACRYFYVGPVTTNSVSLSRYVDVVFNVRIN